MIAACRDTYAVLFLLEGSEGGDKAGVGDLAAFGDSARRDKENCVGARDATADSLREEAKVVSEGADPGSRIWAASEGAVFVQVAGDEIEDGVCLIGGRELRCLSGMAYCGKGCGEVGDEARAEVILVGGGCIVFDEGWASRVIRCASE